MNDKNKYIDNMARTALAQGVGVAECQRDRSVTSI